MWSKRLTTTREPNGDLQELDTSCVKHVSVYTHANSIERQNNAPAVTQTAKEVEHGTKLEMIAPLTLT